jgi:hypothetical protein
MGAWTMWEMAKQQSAGRQGRRRRDGWPEMARGQAPSPRPAPAAGVAVGSRRVGAAAGGRWGALSAVPVWVGYRLIALGCRLAWPGLVSGARAGL